MATPEIFKLQRSLNGSMSKMLIYNKDRSVMHEMSLTKDVKQLFGGRSKAYCWGYLEESGDESKLHLTEPAEDQYW